MEPKITKYILIKDMPDFKRGEIFTLTMTEGDQYYQSEHNDDWGLPRMYPVSTLENNPQWFADANKPLPTEEPKIEPLVNGVESEIIKVHGSEYDFDVTIPKQFSYATCKFCQMENLIWGETKKGKKILVRLNEQNQWVAHIAECKNNN